MADRLALVPSRSLVVLGHGTTTRTFDSKGAAGEWARKIEEEMDRGVYVSRAEAEATTLKEALDCYAVEVSVNKRSGGRETNTIRWWQASPLAGRLLASIRGKDIAATAADGTVGANTVRIRVALFLRLFNEARTA
ncbi:MAG: hypothetical protein ACYDDO_14200 [Acidiferrobacterales bacterium]